MTRNARHVTRSESRRGRNAVALLAILAGCGGGGNSDNTASVSGSNWTSGVFLEAPTFRNRCVAPRAGINPATGQAFADIGGTRSDENNFLRAYSDDTYLWYDEITDRDPALYATADYFDLLRTTATTASGADKDRFHFTWPTDEWFALSQSGVSAGYGVQWVLLANTPPREVRVAYTDPGTPATDAGLVRGTEVLTINGVDLVSGGDVETLNNGLFPSSAGQSYDFTVRDPDGSVREITLVSAIVTSSPVQYVQAIPTLSGKVGYLLFNDHIATAEQALADAIEQLAAEEIVDLVIDIRYNGGGYLYIASELAYMVAGEARTAGRIFENLTFNDKHPSTDPVTGQALAPMPFYNTGTGNQDLPTLNLSRVFVLTGPGTCSASESIINSLRGVDVEVLQIGSTTCGKPYGFYATDNCGTTYFTIQFRGENDKGYGDYADGFAPVNAANAIEPKLPGCAVADDFSKALGDPTEARLATALAYRDGMACPTPSGIRLPGVDKPGAARRADRDMTLPRSPLREMRIVGGR